MHARIRRLASAAAAAAVAVSAAVSAPGPAAASVAAPAGATAAARKPAPAPMTQAQASATARKTGRPVDVGAEESATTTLTANPNGSFTLDTYAQPVRRLVAGAWHSLDATLHRDADGAVRPALTATDLTLSGGGPGPLVTMGSGQASLGLTLPAALPRPTLSGATATYHDVVPGVDLVATVTAAGGYSDVFVVRDAHAAADPAFRSLLSAGVSAHGLKVATDARGGIQAVNAQGATVFSATAPQMWDSAPGTQEHRAPLTAAMSQGAVDQNTMNQGAANLDTANKATANLDMLTLTPDKTLMAASGLRYPLYFDPTWSGGKAAWSTPAENYPGTAYWDKSAESAGMMQVGYPIGGGLWADTLVNFNLPLGLLGSEGTRDDIVSATYYATVRASSNCTPDTIDVFAPSGTLSSSNATWNAWFASGARGGLGSAVGVNTKVPGDWGGNCSGGSTPWTLSTGWITADLAAGKSVQTLAMTGSSYSAEQSQSVYDLIDPASPNLAINFFHAPSVGQLSTSPKAAVIGKGDVILNAPVSDPDGGTMSVKIAAYANGTAADPVYSGTLSAGAKTPATLLVPQNSLDTADAKWGSAGVLKVTWTATATVTDGSSSQSASGSSSFTYDNQIPGAPDIWLDSGGTQPCDGAAGYTQGTAATFYFSGAPGETAPTGYTYQLDEGRPVSTATSTGSLAATVVPIGYANLLTVSAINLAGTVGQVASCVFYADSAADAAPGDMTGDGVPDLLVPGAGTTSLPSGLWLAPGTQGGGVSTSVTDLGTKGTGISMTQSPAQWTGTQVVSGLFQGNGFNDVLDYNPAANSTAECVATVLFPYGQTLPLDPISGQEAGGGGTAPAFTYYTFDPTGSTFTTSCVTSVADGGNLSTAEADSATAVTSATPSFPDLLLVAGGDLYLAPQQGAPGAWADLGGNNAALSDSGDYVLSSTAPGGGSWAGWSITSTQVDGLPAMFAVSPAGAVYYYTPTDLAELACDSATADGTTLDQVACASYPVTPTGPLATLSTSSALQAADVYGTIELWATSSQGVVQTWALSQDGSSLTQQPGTATLGTAQHAWPLNDDTANSSGAVTAADFGAGPALPLTGTGGVAWTSDDAWGSGAGTAYDAQFTGGASGALTASGPAIDLTGSFTVSLWARPTAYGGALISQNGGSSSGFAITENTGGWSFALNTGSGSAAAFDTVTGGSVPLNAWSQITAGYDAGAGVAKLYVDGALVASGSHTPPATGAGGALVIGDAQAGGHFTGQIADARTLAGLAAPAETPPVQPAGMWPLDDGSGTTAADLGTGHHPAALSGTTVWQPGSLLVNQGTATTTGPVLNTASSYTISAWVRLDSTIATATILGQDGNQQSAFLLKYDAAKNRWSLSGPSGDAAGATTVDAVSPAPPSIGVWTQIAGVYDASARALTLYVDGRVAGTTSYTTAFAANGPFTIGRGRSNGASAAFADGSIADARAYQAALDPGQVSWLAQNSTLTPSASSGSIVNTSLNKCLDDRQRVLTNGTPVNSYDCNGSPQQTWTLNSDGSITTGGQCLDVTGGPTATANGTKLQLWSCLGTANQTWAAENDANGNVHLVNPNSGRCLDVPGATLTNATQMQIYDCNNDTAQTWAPQVRTNLAVGTAAASSSQLAKTGWEVANLTNGIYRASPGIGEFSSAPGAAPATEQWAQVDLSTVQPVSEVDIYPRDESAAAVGACFPVDFTLQVSADGSTWRTVATRTGYPQPPDAAQRFDFNVVSARYVRIDATKLSADSFGDYYLQLRQIAVRGG